VRIRDIVPRNGRPYLFIAEAKPVSPFGWKSDASWEELLALAARVGDVVSVHTDPRWGGSAQLIEEARGRTAKPILAKGIHATDEEVRAALGAGADFALVVGRLPAAELLPRCLIEPNTLAELRALPADVAAVWNSRDLRDGGLKPETFAEARALWKGWLCQASNLKAAADVAPGADAVLVGQGLPSFALDSALI
jgi:indole-3-glycerol phosphate synthase